MKIFYYSNTLREFLKNKDNNLGFVPTMGALHLGHIALVKEARAICGQVVVSIFVNPHQFNNASDLQQYPRTLVSDLKLLYDAGTDNVFIPSVTDIFSPDSVLSKIDLSPMDTRYEGLYRPGHFRGVVSVLHNMFDIVEPKHVFFGLKDLQQCLVIEKLINGYFPEIHQHNCAIIREHSGLAMSSRNSRLSAQGLNDATEIFRQLSQLKQSALNFTSERNSSIEKLKLKGIQTEYLDLVQLPTMDPIDQPVVGVRQALVFAGYLEGVRLIDNIAV